MFISKILQHGKKNTADTDVPIVFEQNVPNVNFQDFTKWKKSYADADVPIVFEQNVLNVNFQDFTKWKKTYADTDVSIVFEQNVHFDHVTAWEQKLCQHRCADSH